MVDRSPDTATVVPVERGWVGRRTVFADRRSARSSASPIGNSTTGPAPGLLRPSIADARGSGTQRRYSYHDVLELKVIKQLLDAGISLQRARRAVECMREGLGGDLAATNLVLVGTDSVLAHSDGEVVDLLERRTGGSQHRSPVGSRRGTERRHPAHRARGAGTSHGRPHAGRGGGGGRLTVAASTGVGEPADDAVRPRVGTPFRRAARFLRRPVGVRARGVRPRVARGPARRPPPSGPISISPTTGASSS